MPGPLTPGRRWTAALALLLTAAVILEGAPMRQVARRLPAPNHRTAAPAPLPPDPFTAVVASTVARPLGPAASGPTRTPAAPSLPPATGAAGAPDPGFVAPRVTAVVAAGSGEEAVAQAYLDRAPFASTAVTAGGDDADCTTLSSSADVVIAGDGLDDALTSCLLGAGVVVVAYDAGGGRRDRGGGRLVSTRRAVGDSLVDLAEGLAGADELAGTVGLVADAPLRAHVQAAVPAMRAVGADVVATAFLERDDDVPAAVVELRAAGVSTVVFATSVARQSRWAALHSLLDPNVAYVVADAADAVVVEDYPPVFDGALAHTAVRVPWYARAHGATPAQRFCDEVRPDDSSVRTAYLWCEHVQLMAAAVVAGRRADVPVEAAFGGVVLASPLTSDLRLLDDGTFGPRADAVLRWELRCGCWVEQRAFRERA